MVDSTTARSLRFRSIRSWGPKLCHLVGRGKATTDSSSRWRASHRPRRTEPPSTHNARRDAALRQQSITWALAAAGAVPTLAAAVAFIAEEDRTNKAKVAERKAARSKPSAFLDQDKGDAF